MKPSATSTNTAKAHIDASAMEKDREKAPEKNGKSRIQESCMIQKKELINHKVPKKPASSVIPSKFSA